MRLEKYLIFLSILFLVSCTYKSEIPTGVAKIDIGIDNRSSLVESAKKFAYFKGYDFFDATRDYKKANQITLIELKKNGKTKVIISDMRDGRSFLVAFFNVPDKTKWKKELIEFETILKQHNIQSPLRAE